MSKLFILFCFCDMFFFSKLSLSLWFRGQFQCKYFSCDKYFLQPSWAREQQRGWWKPWRKVPKEVNLMWKLTPSWGQWCWGGARSREEEEEEACFAVLGGSLPPCPRCKKGKFVRWKLRFSPKEHRFLANCSKATIIFHFHINLNFSIITIVRAAVCRMNFSFFVIWPIVQMPE